MKTKFVTSLSVFTLVASILALVSGAMEYFVLNTLSSQPEVRSILLESLQQQYGVAITLEQMQSMLIRHINVSFFSGLLGVSWA